MLVGEMLQDLAGAANLLSASPATGLNCPPWERVAVMEASLQARREISAQYLEQK